MSKDISNEQIKRMIVECRGNEPDLFIDIKDLLATQRQQLLAEIREAIKGMMEYTTVQTVVDPQDLSIGPGGRIPIENRYNQAIKEVNELLSKIGGIDGA